jgi:hypothetical protein
LFSWVNDSKKRKRMQAFFASMVNFPIQNLIVLSSQLSRRRGSGAPTASPRSDLSSFPVSRPAMIALSPFQAPPKAENGLAVPPSVTRNMASSFSGGCA